MLECELCSLTELLFYSLNRRFRLGRPWIFRTKIKHILKIWVRIDKYLLRNFSQSRSSMTFWGVCGEIYIYIYKQAHNHTRISFDEKWACQQFWHARWDHNSNFSILLGCIFIYKNQQCKTHSSEHLSHVSELKNPKQNRQSKMHSCHTDLASMIQTCYQKRLSSNRRFLLTNHSQHKTLSNSDSALRKEQQQIGSRSKPLVLSLPTKSGGIHAVSSAGKILPLGMDEWQDANSVWSSAAGHRTCKHRIVFTRSSVQLRLLKTHGGDFWNAGIKEMVTARQRQLQGTHTALSLFGTGKRDGQPFY